MLVLFLPLPQFKYEPETASPDPADTDIETRLTQLPSPSPQATPQVTPQATPQAPQKLPSPRPAALQAAPPKLPQQTQTAPPASVRPAPAPPAPAPPASAPPAATLPAANLDVPFADFPDLAGATAGCFGSSSCRQIDDGTPFRNAAQTLVEQMTAQGYQVDEQSDLEDTGQKIYRLIAQDGATRYLSVLSAGVGSTVYLLSAEPILLSDLQQVDAVEAKLASLLTPVGSPANTAQLPYPSLFVSGTQARPEISQMRLVPGVAPDQLVNSFSNTLQNNQFGLSELGSYGGGSLYEVSQKAWIGYLNFVPTADQTGTVLIWWQSLPPV